MSPPLKPLAVVKPDLMMFSWPKVWFIWVWNLLFNTDTRVDVHTKYIHQNFLPELVASEKQIITLYVITSKLVTWTNLFAVIYIKKGGSFWLVLENLGACNRRDASVVELGFPV